MLPHVLLIGFVHLQRCRTYASVVTAVVRFHELLQHINIPQGLMFREVFSHASTVKAFNNARLCLFVMGRKMIHSPDSQEIVKVVIQKIFPFIRLQRCWTFVVS